MANRSNQRRHDAPPPTLTLTEMEASHHADHRAFMLKFCGTRINVTVTNKAEAVRRWIRNTRYANKNHLRRSNPRGAILSWMDHRSLKLLLTPLSGTSESQPSTTTKSICWHLGTEGNGESDTLWKKCLTSCNLRPGVPKGR
ncbi:hypothetical protein YC2023_101624 [Brassica napus]